jgi:FtsP/CotA-like multicopper oxidase with cupredoxin domain
MKVDLPLLFPLTVALSAFQRSMGATLSYQPPEFKSEGGLLEVTLTVDLLESLNGQRLASAYNGEPIGPTLRVSPGDKLVVHLENNLETTAVDQELHEYSLDPTNDMINRTIIVNRLSSIGNVYDPAFGFWGLNYVNLHFHGMEFSPSLEMLMEEWVEGGGKKTYVFDIPQDKEPGLNWYHKYVLAATAYVF